MKKHTLIGAVVAALALPTVALADLTTHNNTNETSAVKVKSGIFTNACTGTVPGKLRSVAPPGVSSVNWDNVNSLCFRSGNTCTAEIYMTADCSGPAVATASLDLSSHVVTVQPQPATSKYKVEASGSDVYLSYRN